MNGRTAELVDDLLDEQYRIETGRGRDYVLAAREAIAEHAAAARSVCPCSRCERLTPIAGLILPEVAGDLVEPRPEIEPRRERRTVVLSRGRERRTVVLSGDEWAVLSGNTEQVNSRTPEMIQAWLDGNQRAPEAAWAARLVLGARGTVTSHARRVWAQKAREKRAELLNGTTLMCECRECASMTPLAKLIVRDVDGGWAALAAAKAAKAAKAAQESGVNGSGLTISFVPAARF